MLHQESPEAGGQPPEESAQQRQASERALQARALAKRLARGFPLALREVPGAGLQWESTRHICAGELLLRARPYAAVAAHGLAAAAVCHACLARVPVGPRGRPSPTIRCEGCGQACWCSAECRRDSDAREEVSHTVEECRAFKELARVAHRDGLSTNEATECRLVVRMLSRRQQERARAGSGAEAGAGAGAGGHTYEDVLALVANEEGLRRERPRVHERIVAKVRAAQWALRGGALLEGVGDEELGGLFCREKCNSFGLWSARSSAMRGAAVYPAASFFNHSCAPNVVHHSRRGALLEMRALTPIPADSPLLVSYIELADDTAAARSDTLWNFCFTCACPRCVADRAGDTARARALWEGISRFCCRRRDCVGTLALVLPEDEAAFLECNLCGAHEAPYAADIACSCGHRPAGGEAPAPACTLPFA